MPSAIDPASAETARTASGGMSDEDVYNDQILTEINRSMRAYVNTFLLTDNKLAMSPHYTVMSDSSRHFRLASSPRARRGHREDSL